MQNISQLMSSMIDLHVTFDTGPEGFFDSAWSDTAVSYNMKAE